MTREEHLKWAKQRALEYVEQGDNGTALASMASDLKNHPETESHAGIELGMMLLMSGNMKTPEDGRRFIEGFN